MTTKSVKQRNYYDVIAGLSAFEKSNDFTFTFDELNELTKSTDQEDVKKDDESDKKTGRMIVHSYLGGKVDLSKAPNATYDLSHTLLGGYVPKKQLESLSSIDFAHYFHRSLNCENALEVYDLLIGNEYRHVQQQQERKESNKNVKKIVVCKKCKARFEGADRMKSLYKHHCTSK